MTDEIEFLYTQEEENENIQFARTSCAVLGKLIFQDEGMFILARGKEHFA